MQKNNDITNYIEKMRQRGFNDEQIKDNLKKVGWDEQIIAQHFLDDNIPRPSSPPKPKTQTVDEPLQQLDSKAVWLLAFRHLSLFIILLFFWRSFSNIITPIDDTSSIFEHLLFIFLFLIIYFGIVFVIAKFEYQFYRYALKDQGFYKEYGIIAKKYVTIPYERIQNIDIHQNVLARILGLYSIKIQTAGNSGVSTAEGILPGISKDEAHRLRSELLKKSKEY